ncbi:uncharacterized protein N0V89_001165 [Didymosphaeria variabile]|uniref:Uncharacterized protein n=1 Tax=Didymosphaeria variabile TaxID=1932322 RepID=A0A9W8XYS3_9PLEO|nr:uncharacterized protein N0V89_001165 [Didymosphaeria variabile]KAJ4360599.1 hypothetical protein N0V89_001165 [Didymosphaeria variabile]
MASMAASPRKDAHAFDQTWDASDTAYLDPTSLPIQRLPRAWDRKQEVRIDGNGKNRKKKEIWRKYGTRSRTCDAATNEDPEDDLIICPSCKLIEYVGKKSVGVEAALEEEEEEEEEQDTTTTDVGDNSFSEISFGNVRAATQEVALLPEGEDRRATFTFLFNENGDVADREAADDAPAPTPPRALTHAEPMEQDAIITRGFQISHKTPTEGLMSIQPLSYPELPSMPASEDDAVDANDQNHMAKEVPERHVNEDSVSAQTGDDIMDEDTALETESSAQHVMEADIEAAAEGVACSALPQDSDVEKPADRDDGSLEREQAVTVSPQEVQDHFANFELEDRDENPDENFTEASLQFNIQQDMQMMETPSSDNDKSAPNTDMAEVAEAIATQEKLPSELPLAIDDALDDITSGLTLGPAPSSREPTPRKLRSPSPPPRTASGPDDATMTFAFDDDTALLKDFLCRAAASKANKAENMTRRESLQNRRDSDVVRHALASPRKALEDKDPNSPSKYDNETTSNLSQTLTLDMESTAPLSPGKVQKTAETDDVDDPKAERTSRRSSRARNSRLPAPSSLPTGPPKISVKRDGGDPVVLKKTDAQELSLLTRVNTRKNKQNAVAVNVRLLKLSNDARSTEVASTPELSERVVQVPGKKYVRWDSQLAYFQERIQAIADALADAESLATPDELSTAPPAAKPTRVKVVPKVNKDATPRVRKVKNLGSKNGTPGKGLFTPASLLPDTMLADKEELEEKQRVPKPKTSRIRKTSMAGTDTASAPAWVESKLPVLEVAPVGIDPTKASSKERKSRLATPRKVKLPQLSSTAAGDGKENQGKGIAAATPKKGIPMPSVVVAPKIEMPAVATGLPRRRARKV